MSTNRISRRAALVAATVLASGSGMLLGAGAAHADTVLGSMTAAPATGADTDGMSFTTSGGCTGGGTNLIMSVTGQGFPATGTNVVGNNPTSIYLQNANGGYTVPLNNTMSYFAKQAGITALSGEYDFTLTCRNAFGATTFGSYVGKIWFTSPTTYTSSNPNVTATTTTLSVTPAGSASTGTSITLSAQVSPSAAGTVQFMDGTTALGNPVTVANGTASTTTSALTVGQHALTAVFTPTDPTFGGSTSAVTKYTVSSGVGTTTALAVTPGTTATVGSSVSMTATVTPASGTAGAVGTVNFLDNGSQVGTATVTGGTATFSTTTLAAGNHQLTASFVPTDPNAFQGSTSQAVPYSVTSSGGSGGGGVITGSPATENIITTVAPGALVLSVAGSNVALPPLTLNSASTLFASAGPIQTVTVTDTRAGAPGWALSGQVADFTNGTDGISAENLGWTPRLVNKVDGLNVTLGSAVAPANAVAMGDTGTAGLKTSRTLAVGAGLGTAQLGADLSLVAPTSTKSGTYTAVLTLTVM